jgi:hypothetical protein
MGHFASGYIGDLVREQDRILNEAIRNLDEEMLLRPVDNVVDELVDTYRLEVPILQPDRAEIVDRGEVRGTPGSVRVIFAVPFDGQEGLFNLRPSQHRLASFSAVVRERDLLFTVTLANASKDRIESALAEQLSMYEVELTQLRKDVEPFNEQLHSRIADLVASRREQLLQARDVLSSLRFPVRKRADAVIPVPVKRRLQVGSRGAPHSPGFAPEPEVSARDYEDILASTRSMGLVMERAPGTFSGLKEEGIRDFFLALLNFGFRGDAMGEVFNGEGKTDILIRVEEQNVFIAECKVWGGEARFKDKAIDQLLRYIGWRDTKTAILLFVHQRSVSGVVAKADAVVRAHECFVWVAPGSVGDLERRYVMHWPGDEQRELVLALQVFAVPRSPSRRTRSETP